MCCGLGGGEARRPLRAAEGKRSLESGAADDDDSDDGNSDVGIRSYPDEVEVFDDRARRRVDVSERGPESYQMAPRQHGAAEAAAAAHIFLE